MQSGRSDLARAILAQVGTGKVDAACFTPDARWWINSGASLPMDQLAALLAVVAEQVDGDITLTPGLVIETDAVVVIEAVSAASLKQGGVYANRYLFLFHFDGALVREVREYNDTAHAARCFTFPA